MKKMLFLPLLFAINHAFAQTEILDKYKEAESLLQSHKYAESYKIFRELESKVDKNDTLYNYILFYYTSATTFVEKEFRDKEKFDSAVAYALEALKLIEKGKEIFDEKFAAREFWMVKNVIVSYFGLGQLENAQKYKDILYKAYKEKRLTNGIDEYFNFGFFKWDGKNVWGYEWYEDLPEDRFSKSFSKVVYYVYSTNADGTDKDQLYRLHVLMFHKIDKSVTFDYVLTKRLETAKNEVSGTLYDYTYNKDIDYKKLQADIKEVLKGNYDRGAKKR